jgi:hypothetical protein
MFSGSCKHTDITKQPYWPRVRLLIRKVGFLYTCVAVYKSFTARISATARGVAPYRMDDGSERAARMKDVAENPLVTRGP